MRKGWLSKWHLVPPVVFTILYCNHTNMGNAFPAFCLSILIWAFICLSFIYLNERFSAYKVKKESISLFFKDINIDKKQWYKLSDLEKEKYLDDHDKLEKFENKRIWKKNTKNLLQYEFAEGIIKNLQEWKNLTFQQKIELIEVDELDKLEKEIIRLDEQKKQNEELKKLIDETERLEKSPEYIETMRLYELSQKKDAEKKKREREEFEKRELEKEEKRKAQVIEEQKRIEEIKRKKVLEERKKQEKERYKEYYKRQQREKEKRKKWASEAIEEMIDSGEIDGNNSSDRKRTIPSNVKEIVYVRDKGSCVICGSREDIEYDHIIPFSKGGSNSVNNVQLLCLKCNRSKSDKIM